MIAVSFAAQVYLVGSRSRKCVLPSVPICWPEQAIVSASAQAMTVGSACFIVVIILQDARDRETQGNRILIDFILAPQPSS